MTSHRIGFLVAAAVVAVTVVGFAWSEKAPSQNRYTSKVSGQCPMSGGGDAGSCPYLREKAEANPESGARTESGCTRLEKDARKEAGDASGVCPYSGKSGKTDRDGVRGFVKTGLKNV
ncbi:MAG: hypothetical protein H6Q29_241 [Bacteroidetes bacterium]|nr:hypothetical protein [Bacteroidota bacterium]